MNFISISSPVLNSNGATVSCVDLRSHLGWSFEPRWCNRTLAAAHIVTRELHFAGSTSPQSVPWYIQKHVTCRLSWQQTQNLCHERSVVLLVGPGSIPGLVTPVFSQVIIVPDDATGRRVFSRISCLPRPFIPALLPSRPISPSSALKTSLLRAAQISQFNLYNSWDSRLTIYRVQTGERRRHMLLASDAILLARAPAARGLSVMSCLRCLVSQGYVIPASHDETILPSAGPQGSTRAFPISVCTLLFPLRQTSTHSAGEGFKWRAMRRNVQPASLKLIQMSKCLSNATSAHAACSLDLVLYTTSRAWMTVTCRRQECCVTQEGGACDKA
ncbi:hypothetical protein PR048_017523 [Dryococelus australis]|uniref:Uncharacterized protein n=1 Tax=Dryococelus australis TaxID=614101 RepID=A0ABQ9H9Z2_9NEOP|nr:hypothetical protein PR048_017523 [Dryococelus australis]